MRALLAFLIIESGQAHTRDRLATLLWGNMGDKPARSNLRLTFHRLKEALDKAAGEKISQRLFDTSGRAIRIHPDAANEIWCDVNRFRTLIAQSENHSHDDLSYCTTCHQWLKEGISLYRGDLLEGLIIDDAPAFDEWLLITREQLLQQTQTAYDILIESYQRQQRYELVREYGQRLLALEPWRESTHQQLMRALANGGHRAAALAQYEKCRTVLRAELGTEPGPETVALAEEIEQGTAPHPVVRLNPSQGETKPAPPPPTNLPTRLTPTFGRERLIKKVIGLLDKPHHKLITLTGEGGIGKSRLSLEVGERLRHVYREGVWFVPLAPISAADTAIETERRIATHICEVMDISLRGKVSPTERLLDRLSTGDRLLILDNFEHLLDGANLVLTLLKEAPGLTIIVTSRERLSYMAEMTVPVKPLTVPSGSRPISPERWRENPAVALFLERAERVTGHRFGPLDRPSNAEEENDRDALRSGEQRVITTLCRLLGGMPLALELAAAGLQHHPLEALIDAIQRSLDVIQTDFKDLPERHRSLRAVFESAWERLSPQEQQTFARCALFRGVFCPEAAEAVTRSPLSVIRTLVEKSLLRPTEDGRFELHERLRQFGEEKLAHLENEPRETGLAHSTYYLHYAAEREARLNGPRPQERVAEIDAALDNVRAAWAWAVAGRHSELLSPAVAPLSLFYEIRGNYREADRLFGETAAVFDSHSGVDDRLSLRLHAHEMRAKVRLAEYEPTLEKLNHLLSVATATGDSEISGLLRISIAEILWRKLHYSKAAACLKENFKSEILRDFPEIIASTYYHYGTIEAFTGNLEGSLNHLFQAESYWKTQNNLRRLAQLSNNKGVFYREFGFFEEAENALNQAIRLNIEIEDMHANANILHNLGNISIAQNRPDKAIDFLNKSLSISLESHEKQIIPNTFLNLGEAHILKEEATKAIEEIDRSYLYFSREDLPIYDTRAQFLLGKASKIEGDLDGSLTYFFSALNIAQKFNFDTIIDQILAELTKLISEYSEKEQEEIISKYQFGSFESSLLIATDYLDKSV